MNGTIDPEATFNNALANASRQMEAYLSHVQDSIQEVSSAFAAYESHVKALRQQLEAEHQELLEQRMQLEHDKADLAAVMDQAPAPAVGDAGSPGRRRFSRSRSPMRRQPNDVHDEVRQACERMGLDETATRQLGNFSPEEALKMLSQVNSDIRNPSAFITKLCQRTAQQADAGVSGYAPFPMALPPPEAVGAGDRSQVEAAIQEIGLDESAARGLRDLPPDQAMQMLEQVDKSVRNPSAFIMSMYNKSFSRGGGGRGGKGGRHNSNDARSNEEEDRSSHRWNGSQTNGSTATTNDVNSSKDSVVESMAGIARMMDLDEACMSALSSIEPHDALAILQRLVGDIQNGSLIRNRSAFVRAEVKKRSVRNTPPSSGGHPASSVPCKFWPEGRCKNGSECRFSHD